MLPETYRIHDIRTDLTNGLVLLRLAESIKGRPSDPPVPDSLFRDENNIEGMFKLFDYLLDNDVYVLPFHSFLFLIFSLLSSLLPFLPFLYLFSHAPH